MTRARQSDVRAELSRADVLLIDGSVAVIRPLRLDDRDGLDALHEAASSDSLHFRFFSASRKVGHDYVAHLFSKAGPAVCLVVTIRDQLVAVATAEKVDEGVAEVAFLVADNLRGHGLGSLLLEHLAAAARDLGIRRFTAQVLADNLAMSRVFLDAGFHQTRTMSEGVLEVELSTAASARAVAAADVRESHSEARSLAALTTPRLVAVVGARQDATGIGHAVLDSIRAGGFTGELVAVHPRAHTIDGITAYPRLSDIPGHVDIAVIAVPATAALEVTRDAVEAGVSTMVVISSGFGELGEAGAAIQRRIVRLARDNSIRVVGPNCLGVMINDPGVRLNATFTRLVPPAGGLAMASQSGGVGIALLDVATRMGLGMAAFVSLGNKADVSSNDLLAAWLEDPRVTAAALYLESFGNAGKFARMARTFSERKPLLAVMGGRSAGGQRAGASHTAAAATPAVGVDALFEHTGVIACRSAEAIAETALLLAEQPLPKGRRVAIISNAGGMGVLAADAADANGLIVPELSAPLRARVQRHVGGTAGTSNPIDLGAGVAAADLEATVTHVLASGEVDAVVAILVATSVADPTPLLGAVSDARSAHLELPVILVAMGGLDASPGTHPGVTSLPSVDAAVNSLARVSRYAEWLQMPHDETVPHDDERAVEARLCAHDLLDPDQAAGAGRSLDGWLSPQQVTALLTPYDLAPRGRVALSALEAAKVAVEIGFPVAVKVADPDVVHKTDRGLVRTGLQSAEEVVSAVQAFEQELRLTPAPVLVQPMATGVELALGIVRDPGFGPLVMAAAGGIATDVWDDRAFLIPPVSPRDAARAVRSLRIWPLLEGYRGSEPADVSGLEQLLVSLGELAVDVPQLAELDLNPVIVMTKDTALVDVKVRLARPTMTNAGIPRQLRPAP